MMDSLPDSWNKPTKSGGPNSHTVISALEIPSATMFPHTGAAVRAVALDPSLEESSFAFGFKKKQNVISRPGDTFWLGATGAGATGSSGTKGSAIPPDIEMNCIDKSTIPFSTAVITITWDQSWKDVLDELRYQFGKACTFNSPDGFVVDSEDSFDRFCSEIEASGRPQTTPSGSKYVCTVYIQHPVHTVSPFITNELVSKKQFPKLESADQEELADKHELVLSTDVSEIPTELAERKSRSFWKRWDDTPYPLEYTIAFGVSGFVGSCAAIVAGYWIDWNSLAAITLATSWNIFLMSLFVTAVEDGFPSLGRLGVGIVGFFCSLTTIACLGISGEYIGVIAAALWLLACFWFVEEVVTARGWGSWYTGAYMLFSWFLGGCPLQGFRKPEPEEEIIILGIPPKPNLLNRMKTLKERYPGCTWERPARNQRVMHVGQCLSTLSERGNPMGPYRDGIIHKSLARQLRKWLLRNGKELLKIGAGKEEMKLKEFAKLGMGTVERTTTVNDISYAYVKWDVGTNAFHLFGEDNVFELIKVKEKEGNIGEYHDGEKIHGGGNTFVAATTFMKFFLPRFCTFLWYWTTFWVYMLILYGLEYSITSNAVQQAMGSQMFHMKGALFNTEPGGGLTTSLHIYCKGFTSGEPSPRPVVILETMEGIGSGVSMARLQDAIAQRGVCCTYDRMGLGFSSSLEVSTIWADRSPSHIAQQLYFALINGVDRVDSKKPGWTRNVNTVFNYTASLFNPIQPPFIFLGHGAGTLYMRQLAHDYPNITAGLILVDPLPALHSGLPSYEQLLLSPFMMTLCTRILQPTGIVRNFLPSIVTGLFDSKAQYLLDNGGVFNDFEVMIWQMYSRQWCPSVLAEWNGLYVNTPLGIDTVAKADLQGYSVPTAIWVRDVNSLSGVASSDAVYNYGLNGFNSSQSSSRRGCSNCVSYLDICENMLQFFPNSWKDPFSGVKAVMRGDPDTCQIYGCNQLAPLENPVEIQQAVLDIWYMLGYSDPYPSNVWAFELQGYPRDFLVDPFIQNLTFLLRHIDSSQIEIRVATRTTRRQSSEPRSPEPNEYQGQAASEANSSGFHSNRRIEYTGYSGSSSFGTATYVPLLNEGTFVVEVIFFGHKPRSTEWAAENIRGTEDTSKDNTAMDRRTQFIHTWRIISITERTCTAPGPASGFNCTAYQGTSINLFAPTFSTPSYQCPQNSYALDAYCQQCPPGQTSRAGSQSPQSCFECPAYFYLNCRGDGCGACPNEDGYATFSDAASLHLSDCVTVPRYTIVMKGPIGAGYLSEAVTTGYQVDTNHSAYDAQLFLDLLVNLTQLPASNITIQPPTYTKQYPESRCVEQRGGCTFSVTFQIYPPDSGRLTQVLNALNGDECTDVSSQLCLYPDPERNFRRGRSKLFSAFPIVSFYSETLNGADSNQCPNFWNKYGVSKRSLGIFNSSFVYPQYTCPHRFYADSLSQSCLACPDMTTSNSASDNAADCVPWNSIILVGKDDSLSYESRTNILMGGQRKAQPNAIDIMGELSTNASYIKTRGYALQLHELINIWAPPDIQAEKCAIGLNCFNTSHFRLELSSFLTGTTANEIRLISPECNGNIVSDLAPDLCGPWPGLPPISTQLQCVCANKQAAGFDETGELCFWTAGANMVSRTLGNGITGDASSFTVQTAADCAQRTLQYFHDASEPEQNGAFLYNPSTRTCVPRLVESKHAGQDVCTSTSVICRSLASEPQAVELGMQMYWADVGNVTRCVVKLEVAQQCSTIQNGHPLGSAFAANSTGLPNALDMFYIILNTHSQTGDELLQTLAAWRNPTAGFRDFLKRYNILQVMIANDKQPISGVGREMDLQSSGNINVSSGLTIACNYTCQDLSLADFEGSYQPSQDCTLCSGQCKCQRAVDGNLGTSLPLKHNSFFTLDFTQKQSGDNVAYMLVTRVDIALCILADGSGTCATSVTAADALWQFQLLFSDGSTRNISMSMVGSIQVIYIEPSVSHFVSLIYRGASSVGLSHFSATGQAMDELYQSTFSAVDIFSTSSSSPYSGGDGYHCPATTYANHTLGMCVPCIYPTVSLDGSGFASNCTCPYCGDGRLHWQADEECDDGNAVSGDGCDSTCKLEVLQFCFGPRNNKTGVGLPLLSYAQKDQCLRLGSYWTPFGTAPWEARFGMASLVHQGAGWVIGGMTNQGFLNDSWFEISNGRTCTAIEPVDSCIQAGGKTPLSWSRAGNEPFAARGFHQAVSFQESLWILGGATRNDPSFDQSCQVSQSDYDCFLDTTFSDVWKLESRQTPTWLLVSPSGPWTSRAMHSFVVYQNQMWILGGIHMELRPDRLIQGLKDVWHSSDGANWVLATQDAAWAERAGHSVVVFQPQSESQPAMYLMGGRKWTQDGSYVFMNDVWRSFDGVTWNLVTASAPWPPRWMHGSAAFEGGMWIVGGCGSNTFFCTTQYADVWVGDGSKFDQSTAAALWGGRSAAAAFVFDSQDPEVYQWKSVFVFDSQDPEVYKWTGNSGTNMWLMGGQNANFQAQGDTFNIFRF